MFRTGINLLVFVASLICFPTFDLRADPLWGPETYERTTGQPNQYSKTFANCEPEAKYELLVINGDESGAGRLSSATITLNGQEVLRPNDLNQQVGKVTKPVEVLPENTLKVRLASLPKGKLTVSIECTENCFSLTIDSPTSGEIVNQSSMMVLGEVNSATKEVGVAVSFFPGVVAGLPFIFAVPDVSLGLGSNTLTATATNICGMQATDTVQVDVQGIQEPLVILSANPSSGVAPVDVRLRTIAVPPNPVAGYSWNISAQTDSELLVTYDLPGLFFPQVTVTDTEGLIYTATSVVNVIDPMWLDKLLQVKWGGMREALAQSDIEKAVGYFTGGSRDRYRQIFELIQDDLDEEAENLQDIVLVSFNGSTAKYRIQRTVSRDGVSQVLTYWVYFIQDTDGIWRIRQF